MPTQILSAARCRWQVRQWIFYGCGQRHWFLRLSAVTHACMYHDHAFCDVCCVAVHLRRCVDFFCMHATFITMHANACVQVSCIHACSPFMSWCCIHDHACMHMLCKPVSFMFLFMFDATGVAIHVGSLHSWERMRTWQKMSSGVCLLANPQLVNQLFPVTT